MKYLFDRNFLNWIIYIRFLEKNKDSSKNTTRSYWPTWLRVIIVPSISSAYFFAMVFRFFFFFVLFFSYLFVRKTVAKRIAKHRTHDASRKHSFYVGSVGQDVGFNRLVAMILFNRVLCENYIADRETHS